MRALLLFVLLTAQASAWDHFEFDITLFCNYPNRDTYNLNTVIWETDTFGGEDQISQPKMIKPKTGRFSFSMNGALNGDEIASAGYKPKIYFDHDCTNDGKSVKLTLTITTLCEIGYTCHYRIIRDITNSWGNFDVAADGYKLEMTPFPDFP